jgi:hypothetical protein
MGRHVAKGSARSGETGSGSTSTVADLQLLLRNRRLLMLCGAVVLVSFGVYFVLILALRKFDDWALFVFAPMVLSGVLVGALLDRAYAAHVDQDPDQDPDQAD